MGWSFYLLIFFVVVVVNLLTKSRVDGVGAFKKVGSLLTGDRVQGERANEVGLFSMEIRYFRKKKQIADKRGPGRRWSGWDRWSSTWTFPPGRQDTGRGSRHGTVDSHWPRQRSSRRTGRRRWTRPRCSPGWSWSLPPGPAPQISGPGLGRRLVSTTLRSDIQPHWLRLTASHLLSGGLSEGEESH